jgi:hypothetical protein
MALVATAFGGILALRPDPQPITQVVYVIKEVPKRTARVAAKPSRRESPRLATVQDALEPAYPQTPYLQMENHLLRWGLDGLPALPPVPPSEKPLTRAGILEKAADVPSAVPFLPLTFLQKLGDPS